MKNRLRTGMVLGSILILLFIVSFYNFLQVRTKEKDMDEQKQVREFVREANLAEDPLLGAEVENDTNLDLKYGEDDITHGINSQNKDEKRQVSTLEKITEHTKLKLVGMNTFDERNIVNVTMNSTCFEMGFTEFSEYLNTHKMEVLTEKVYELNNAFDPRVDSVTILSFGTSDVILGISCGKTRYQEINPCFDYLGIVDGEVIYVYHLLGEQGEKAVYMNCELTEYNFPDEILKKLENGVFFQDEKELYNFLESYSS